MSSSLADFIKVNTRFSRSANVERDHGRNAIEGYAPTGRALDVISRIAQGLVDPAAGRTFSLTGPHGGGKSSLAVFLDALLASSSSDDFKSAHAILASAEPSVDSLLRKGIRSVKGGRDGFVRAFATANKEPVSATIARALHQGTIRSFGSSQSLVPPSFASKKHAPTGNEIRSGIGRIASERPVLLVIDEFGKNLEHFASSSNDGDPFLLQELAEMTQGEGAAPLVIITMQHLSFDEYVQDSSTARRREWSKVQGRFQDIPYVESAAQSRRLIASAITHLPEARAAADQWLAGHRAQLETLGLRDLVDDVVAAIPLHPIALAVLPELCSRYGQNERTLFSFLAGTEPGAVPRFLRRTPWHPNDPMPLIGLDQLYDYFLEASSSMISVADEASRWIEIETRIRDSAGLTPAQMKAVKTIGVLNLVSSGGRIRASRPLLELALAPTHSTTKSEKTSETKAVLEFLTQAGIITYRTFSDEYRIWHGSDYNLLRVIETARRACDDVDLVDLLRAAVQLEPLVAGRHSQRTGVLRVFERQFSSLQERPDEVLDSKWDGVVYYATDPAADPSNAPTPSDGRPAVYVVPDDVSKLRNTAIDAAALNSALRSAEVEGADWVAKRELVERAAAAQQALHAEIGQTWNAHADWILAGSNRSLEPHRGLSALLSDVADASYCSTPLIANEMIARRELTSQGAKARRFLIDALLAREDCEAFAIEGYGPDRAMYEAIFRGTGIHRPTEAGVWRIQAPSDRRWKPIWTAMNSAFDNAVESRVSLDDIGWRLKLPPFGIKDGLVPLLLIAGLVARSDEIALYEHGSLILSIDDAVAERLAKNLGNFSLRNTQTAAGERLAVIDRLVDRLGITSRLGRPTFLNLVTALYREFRLLPPYSQKTRMQLSAQAIAVREAFHQAAEPDVLVFETLPVIFSLPPFGGRGRSRKDAVERFTDQLVASIRELRDTYPRLLESVQQQLGQATSTGGSLAELREALTSDARRIDGQVLEPRLKAFVGALARPLEDQEWLENVAMVVCDGQAPRTWTDDMVGRFPLRVAELGGALRRTMALLHERLASNVEHGYAVSRLTLTRPDGAESVQLLSLTEQEKELISPLFDDFVATLMKRGVSRSVACRMLMARLAEEHNATDPAEVGRPIGGEDQRYG
ncbi:MULTISPECIES: hypothetical protein [unclassified Mycobacterium]|uniref:hypothetical protein n=1 Tax=unclassified Mycobacterium TaxID=2642494 RepID=UPI00080136EE|nr:MULTISPECIES: hypothetical protein [unclassified Mycobacterium]OBG78133.1 hypothetical protein A5700_17585 [Mycobacterium sp. E1214]OBH30004.1 hypothetical protein A5693_18580 [Mycobacterium sp. E1319]